MAALKSEFKNQNSIVLIVEKRRSGTKAFIEIAILTIAGLILTKFVECSCLPTLPQFLYDQLRYQDSLMGHWEFQLLKNLLILCLVPTFLPWLTKPRPYFMIADDW